jgi:hypothetical protein
MLLLITTLSPTCINNYLNIRQQAITSGQKQQRNKNRKQFTFGTAFDGQEDFLQEEKKCATNQESDNNTSTCIQLKDLLAP